MNATDTHSPASVIDQSPSLVWFRDDLRLADNPALAAAIRRGAPVFCVYIQDDASQGPRRLGAASKWWLSRSLKALSAEIQAKGGKLHVMSGACAGLIDQIVQAAKPGAVFWNRRYGQAERDIDAAIKASLKAQGIAAETFNSHLLNEPWEVTTQAGTPMKVFTPYWRAARALGEPASPVPAPARIQAASLPPALEPLCRSIDSLDFEPTSPDWATGMRAEWQPGEAGAANRLDVFLEGALKGYGEDRNRPDYLSTSKLSPHLRFGEIGPRQVWHAAKSAVMSGQSRAPERDLDKFLAEIGWREFAFHLLFHNPELATRNFNPKFDDFAWRSDSAALKAWQKGQTGYPLVDAGMRELWTTGWMHNRVRMVVGSFLVKHLMLDWREGERWFWDTLVDACPANNTASWQWVAGTGADAAPYFRIFNPFGQGEKFDTAGDYVRRWVPELGKLRQDLIHRPWEAPPAILLGAGVKLGVDYPKPVVDHDAARARALAALSALKPNVV
ncbi:MAG: cryptochrome/photolyase family protein [Bosea sp. (in: a-proteobacteria)]